MSEIQKIEVAWYKKNGKHSDRISLDDNCDPYVIGDWAWNKFTSKPERIEHQIRIPNELKIESETKPTYE